MAVVLVVIGGLIASAETALNKTAIDRTANPTPTTTGISGSSPPATIQAPLTKPGNNSG